MKTKWIITVVFCACFVIASVILSGVLNGSYEAIRTFIFQFWVALLTFTFSSFSLAISVLTYYNKTKPNLKISMNNKWEFELESEDLGDGTMTAVITPRQGNSGSIALENSGGSSTTLRSLKVSKKRYKLLSNSVEVLWRRDFHLLRVDAHGNLVPLSIWDRIEPGQRVIISMPYIDILDVMTRNKMLDLNKDAQGDFYLTFSHVFSEKSTKFTLTLSSEVRRFIQERVDEFGSIIVRGQDTTNREIGVEG